MFPIIRYVGRDLYTSSQGAEETVLQRIDYDPHMTPPDYQIPGLWLRNALEFFDPPIKSARRRILVVQANALIQGMNQV